MQKEEILFKTSSVFRRIFNLLMRLFCVMGILYAVENFDQNRILISILIILLVIFFLTINDTIIIVYNNRIEYISKRIITPLSTCRKIYFNDIENINIKLRLTFIIDFITTIFAFIPSSTISFNTIIIEQKTNKPPTTIVTKIYENEIRKAFKIVEASADNKIKIIYN
jgi:hypothetical protein